MRRLLHRIGYTWTRVDGRRFLKERPDVVAKRCRFLRQYRDLCAEYDHVVWVDETWIFRRGAMKFKTWQNLMDVRSCPVKTCSTGKRYIVLHAGGKDGFIPGAGLVFASQSNAEDYHGEMNTRNFQHWFANQLLPNLKPRTLIIMDNASYHKGEALTLTFLACCDNRIPSLPFLQGSPSVIGIMNSLIGCCSTNCHFPVNHTNCFD